MSSSSPSSTEICYLIGLRAPQQLAAAVEEMRCIERKQGWISDPLPPMIPLFESSMPIHPPVPGLIPPCESPLLTGTKLINEETSGLKYLPVNADGWLNQLERVFSKMEKKHQIRPLYPPFYGIPISFPPADEDSANRKVIDQPTKEPISGWRALVLECFRIDFDAGRPWFLSVSWSFQWCRRLRRAPSPNSGED